MDTLDPQLKDVEIRVDDDIDDWLEIEMEKYRHGQEENEEDALADILKLLGVSIVTNDDIQNGEGVLLRTLPCQLPPKELSLGSFTLPCTIGSFNLYAMVYFGACVNIMTNLIFKHLKLTNLMKTDMLVRMADITKQAPSEIVDNVLLKIDKFFFLCDFVVIDMPRNLSEMMILGRPFLATIHARINVFNEEISLGIGEDRIMFDVNGNIYHPKVPIIKVYMTNSFQEEESFILLEIGDDLFSYESPEPEVEHGSLPLAPREDTSLFPHEDLMLNVKTYFGDSSQSQPNKPRPRDYSFKEWLRAKIGHTNVTNSVRHLVMCRCA
ncbi:hypothetical protein Tco_1098886 [Tanacetum coccineum]